MSRIRKLEQLSEPELVIIANLKNKLGNATREALKAQRILWDRQHWEEIDFKLEREKGGYDIGREP